LENSGAVIINESIKEMGIKKKDETASNRSGKKAHPFLFYFLK
jgi:hypothetical protein